MNVGLSDGCGDPSKDAVFAFEGSGMLELQLLMFLQLFSSYQS